MTYGRLITVEPSGFRRDFAGRSLTLSASAISDYADTSGKRRKETDTVHGTQPGDPAKAARARRVGREPCGGERVNLSRRRSASGRRRS